MKELTEESQKRMMEGARKSGAIAAKLKVAAVKKFNASKKKCIECEKLIPYSKRTNKFCSRSCSVTCNNKKKDSRKPCPNCKTLTNNYKCCSRKCSSEYRRMQANKKIEESGIATGSRAKPYLIETRGYRCEICKIEEWMGTPVPLVRDHINGNADDNSVKNQRLICHNCDAQLPTFAGRNYGNGRAERRKIYKRLGYC